MVQALAEVDACGLTFKLQPALARAKVEQARVEFTAGNVQLAEEIVVAALLECPNSFAGYQFLGEVLDARGAGDCAVQAYLGEFPQSLIDKYISPVQAGAVSSKIQNRVLVHRSERVELPEPARLQNAREWRFKNKQIVSNETWVDTIDNGQVWHDGHNTLVFDSAGEVIDEHTMGSVGLVRNLISRYEPLNPGPRVFLLGARGGGNFYHWITDILPKIGVLLDAGYRFNSTDCFVVPVFNKSFQVQTLKACGISSDQVIETHLDTPYLCSRSLVVPRLKNVMGLHMGRWLIDFLQDTLLDSDAADSSGDGSNDGSKIFVSRDPSASNGRSIANIEELNAAFEKRGFDIVYPERLTLLEQARCFHRAEVIFAPHGAGLTNIVFCKPKTKIVEFYGAHIAPCYWAISALNDMEYFNESCDSKNLNVVNIDDGARTLSSRRSAGFSVDIDRLNRLFELVGID